MWGPSVFLYACVFSVYQIAYAASDLNTNRLEDSISPALNLPGSNEKSPGYGDYPCPYLKPMDCAEVLQLGYVKSGVYEIWPRNKLLGGKSINVFCNMDTDNGGWTVLQRRGHYLRPIDYFYKDWASYKRGFGDIKRDFWLGNDNIFALTNQQLYSVRFDLADVEGERRYAMYDTFFIESEENKYKLTINYYTGTANDSMIVTHNGQMFSTKDQDNDQHENSCAIAFKGAWWYNACHTANLNGLYLRGPHESFADGVNWVSWKGYFESLEITEIMIRPQGFQRDI